ncbi:MULTISPECIES: hypothetical protein [Flavobacterium]|uniref:Lipoprotein n=1 Tax=Flavobacterium jumunjinense TaxID=998845 RepID=A0ABV5GRQ0_9FLAO|nr:MULTISPECIES: hypothetical protein [Flavobacterium]
MKLILMAMFILLGCNLNSNKKISEVTVLKDNISNVNDSIDNVLTKVNGIDTIVLKESYNKVDIEYNDYLKENLKLVRVNFKRINSISNKNWKSIIQKDYNISSEGGVVSYYSNEKLEKITVRNFAETNQKLTEYYLLDDKLSFVFEKWIDYEYPIYDETFSESENEIVEQRSYFIKSKLVHQVNNQNCGSPFASDYLKEEEKRIIYEFSTLIKYKNSN